jgi:hypothetical protein
MIPVIERSALYHFSEEATITRFEPRPYPSYPALPPAVFAIHPRQAPHYFFPRDCPRVCFWAEPASRSDDIERLLSGVAARRVIAIEGEWLERIRTVQLFIYSLPPETFTLWDEPAGYYISHQPVTPLRIEPAGDLLARLVAAGVELRITPSLWPLRHALVGSSLGFSMIRLRNAHPEMTME